jgi:hypothetical protein
LGSRPSYFFFQLKYVAWPIRALRQTSATGIPSEPCFKMNAFCASVNFDAFILLPSSQPWEQVENSNQKRSSFQGSDHRQRPTLDILLAASDVRGH